MPFFACFSVITIFALLTKIRRYCKLLKFVPFEYR